MKTLTSTITLIGIAILISACARRGKDSGDLTSGAGASPVAAPVSYLSDIHPILARSCGQCHLGGKAEGDYNMATREGLLAPGEEFERIIPGDGEMSMIIDLVAETIPGAFMPKEGPRLSPDEIDLLRRWIDEGAEWERPEPYVAAWAPPLAPRRFEPPAARGRAASQNPIDRILASYFKQRRIKPGDPIEDARYLRRVGLDVVGLLPEPRRLDRMMTDASPNRREQWIDQLLDDRQAYAEHWMTFWNDMLRNDFAGTGYIDGGRKQITDWLYEALASNKPFDQFVRELVSPTPRSEGFVKGIVWRGAINASQVPAMQAAQNLSQVFVGTNIKCASCHDSFINQWKLADSYGLASVFADAPLEMVRCDAATGQMAGVGFIFPELGEIDPALPRPEKMKRLAEIMTSEANGRLARTIVNRLWARFFGRGLVEPIDDMDQKPWNPDLLDWLAADLADHGFDLKHTIRLMLTSRAYQMPSVAATEIEKDEFVFRGPVVRRMNAEQFLDAIASVTGVWRYRPSARVDFLAAYQPPESQRRELRELLNGVQWIWSDAQAATFAPAQTVYFRKSFDIANADGLRAGEADLFIAADNAFRVYINGAEAGQGDSWRRPGAFDIRHHLRDGRNVIAIGARNTEVGPAGLAAYLRLRSGDRILEFNTDTRWKVATAETENWNAPDFDDADWAGAAELGGLGAQPWANASGYVEAVRIALVSKTDTPRAWSARADALMRALGRPNREQVVTRRASVATTLQAIELTNGKTLSDLINQASESLTTSPDLKPEPLVSRLYVHALAREPNRRELALARELVGEPVQAEGLADLLWAIVNLPEFQLIY